MVKRDLRGLGASDNNSRCNFKNVCTRYRHQLLLLLDESRHAKSYTNTSYATFFIYFVTKWPPAAILDDKKSLFITFLVISDKYATWTWTWTWTFLVILDPYATFNFFEFFFTKWPPAVILDDRKSRFIALTPFQIDILLSIMSYHHTFGTA